MEKGPEEGDPDLGDPQMACPEKEKGVGGVSEGKYEQDDKKSPEPSLR
jgi:hypothetical protein